MIYMAAVGLQSNYIKSLSAYQGFDRKYGSTACLNARSHSIPRTLPGQPVCWEESPVQTNGRILFLASVD